MPGLPWPGRARLASRSTRRSSDASACRVSALNCGTVSGPRAPVSALRVAKASPTKTASRAGTWRAALPAVWPGHEDHARRAGHVERGPVAVRRDRRDPRDAQHPLADGVGEEAEEGAGPRPGTLHLAVATLNSLTGARGPLTVPQFNADTRQALASLDRLIDLDASLALPGHGEPWTGTLAEAVRLVRASLPSSPDRSRPMASNPLNLALRFVLELVALGGLALLGWTLGGDGWQLVAAIVLPVAAAAAWVTFRIPNDPDPRGSPCGTAPARARDRCLRRRGRGVRGRRSRHGGTRRGRGDRRPLSRLVRPRDPAAA